MPTITLATRARSQKELKTVEKFLKSKLKNLRVEIQMCRTTPNNWVKASISGEDERVALNYINEEIGLCPSKIEDVKKFSTLKGYITEIKRDKIVVDVGIFPEPLRDFTINLAHLQAALADGRGMTLEKIAELYGFCEGHPLNIKVINFGTRGNNIDAILAETQLKTYRTWIEALLDKILALGATQKEIMLAIKAGKCERDVIATEALGIFEHALTCKLGTNAEGLIPKLGRFLSNTVLTVFSPKKILELFN